MSARIHNCSPGPPPRDARRRFEVGEANPRVATETSLFLAFGISAASLLFLNLGVERIPVTHRMTLPAGTAALATTNGGAEGSVAVALLVAEAFGLACGLFGELFQRVFYAHGDTHWDSPAAAIVFGTFLVFVLYAAGVFPSSSGVATFGP